MSENPENISEALVREYLSKNNLASTLKKFEIEKPRSSSSISNRNELRKVIGMEKMAAKLKRRSEDQPLPSTLEMLVTSQLAKIKAATSGAGDASEAVGKMSLGSSAGGRKSEEQDNRAAPPRPKIGGFTDQADPPPAAAFSSQPEIQPPRKPRTMFGEESTSQPLAPVGRSPQRPGTAGSGDMMVMEDFDEDFDSEPALFSKPPSSRGPSAAFGQDKPSRGVELPGAEALSPDEARGVKAHLFGRLGAPPSWKQGFFFSKVRGLEYGLVQKEGGPCGILAGVQARILYALANGGPCPVLPSGPLSGAQQQQALTQGIAASLIQAGGGRATVMTCSERSTADMSIDQLLRCCKLVKVRSSADAERVVGATLSQFQEEDGWGIILFLFSLVLSHGLQQVKKDMDEPDNTLMGMHGYCTQDLVNLIICGHAVTNVFDGNKTLDEHTTLKGVPGKSQVGFLSLFEWYKYIEVGDIYKKPACAVWVVCCESHFTCMFSTDPRSMKDSIPFDLYYYDGLANQDEVIRFSITRSPTGGHTGRAGDTIGSRGATEGDLTPPLEFVIETRWPGVHVNWNGTDPIL